MGFNLTKILAEKNKEINKDLKIETKIDLQEIKEAKSDFIKNKEVLIGIKFNYSINYSPDIANLIFEGNILLVLDSKEAKEILKSWKEKKIPEEFRVNMFNIILMKSNVKALSMENELNLPLHFKLPTISLGEKPKTK